MLRSPRNVEITFNHAGLTHYGGAFFLHEFLRVRQLRHFSSPAISTGLGATTTTASPRWYGPSCGQWFWGWIASKPHHYCVPTGPSHSLLGCPASPTLKPCDAFCFGHPPASLSNGQVRMSDGCNFSYTFPTSDPDWSSISTVPCSPSLGVRKAPRSDTILAIRGKRSYQPLLGLEANSTHLGATQLRPGDIDPHSGTVELFRSCWSNLPAYIREVRVRADAGFYNDVPE